MLNDQRSTLYYLDGAVFCPLHVSTLVYNCGYLGTEPLRLLPFKAR